MIQKVAAVGFVGSAVMASLGLMPMGSALALTEQQILEKLNRVPVFLIVNSEGQSLTTSVETDETDVQVPIVFINSGEAQAFLDRAVEEQAEFAGNAQIAVLPLSDIYQEASGQLEGANSLVYVPSIESVNNATQLVNREIRGVPLYAAVDLDNDRYLLTGDSTLPIFFSLQDLQQQISSLLESDPEIEESIGVEVLTFEVILGNMTANDPDVDELLELIQFVPASETIDYLRSLSGAEGSSGQ